MTNANVDQLTRWRQDLHRLPGTGFDVQETADYVAEQLDELGLAVMTGIGGVGVVGTLTKGASGRAIALRADMDGLPIEETAGRALRSRTPNRMHGCGHDGHMAMVLGAAARLSSRPTFDGTVRFLFQPAEEPGKGASAMLDDGLLDRLPFDEIYALHNDPGTPAGDFLTRVGGIMGSEDNFVIHIHGRGGHAARPHMTADPLVAAAALITALQTVVARAVDPGEGAVLSCTEIVTDGSRNAIPGTATITGDTRSYSPQVQALLEQRIRELADGVAAAHGCAASVKYTHEFAPTINDANAVAAAVRAAEAIVGETRVTANTPPMMTSEDFGRFLEQVPGALLFIGNGAAGTAGGAPLHSAEYLVDDRILPIGADFYAELVRQRLPVNA